MKNPIPGSTAFYPFHREQIFKWTYAEPRPAWRCIPSPEREREREERERETETETETETERETETETETEREREREREGDGGQGAADVVESAGADASSTGHQWQLSASEPDAAKYDECCRMRSKVGVC